MESTTSSSIPIHLLPVVIAVWLPVSFLITYSIAVSYGHVYPWWPAISSTGTIPPDSCFFSFFVNISTFLILFAGYVRHMQLREFTRHNPQSGPSPWVNFSASLLGLLSGLGLLVVANWQVSTTPEVHYSGAEICFFCGTIYFAFQSVFSFWMAPEMNSLLTCGLRGALTVLMILCNIGCNYANYVGLRHYSYHTPRDILHWKPGQPYYLWHLTYTILEWALMLAFALNVLTFLPDFRRIRLEEPVLKLRRKWNDYDL